MLLIHSHCFGSNFAGKKPCLILAATFSANTKQGFFQQNWIQNSDYVLATFLEKSIINYSSKKKGTIFFFGIIFVERLLKKDFKIIVPKKRNYMELYLFFGIIFGDALLKKDFKIIVPKKELYFFWHYIW